MNYSVAVHPKFEDDLARLSKAIQDQLRKKLEKIIENTHIPKNRLSGFPPNCYKIKLLKAGVRLVYQVIDDEVIILLVTVGKREDSVVYEEAVERLQTSTTPPA